MRKAPMQRYENLSPGVKKRLAGPVRLTLVGLWVERGLRAFWPFGSVVLAGFAAVIFGALALGPVWVGQVLAGLVILLALAALIQGVRSFKRPQRSEALARLDAEQSSGAIAALTDEQASGADDPASRALWVAHLNRMEAALAGLRPVPAKPNLAPRDPFALRLMALTAGAMALAFGLASGSKDMASLIPGAGGDAPVAPSSWEAWIEPPKYTGKPTLYLADQPEGPLTVQAGARITLRLYGQYEKIDVTQPWSEPPENGPQPTRFFVVDRDGTLSIDDQSWQITALADALPEIAPLGELDRKIDGEMTQGFEARDDYGVVKGRAEIALDLTRVKRRFGLAAEPEPREPVLVDLPMPFRGDRTMVEGRLVENLAEHPFATLPVTLTLIAEDGAGQEGRGEPKPMILPGKRFFNPLAGALIEQRRDLYWSMDNAQRVARVLRALSHAPEGVFPKDAQYLTLRTLVRAVEADGFDAEAREEVAAGLYALAVEIEDGALADARARLDRAQERIEEAIRQGASPDEMSELMNEMREAMADYMRQLAEQAGEQDMPEPREGETMEMSGQDLQDLMDQIEEALREGRFEEAAQLMEMLRQLTENMQMAEGQGQGEPNAGEQAMEGLADTLRQQQNLSDETFQQQNGGENQQGQPGDAEAGEGQSGDGENGEEEGEGDLASRQRALEDALEQQRRNMPGAGTEEGDAAREALNDAGRAMEDAAEALERGEPSRALDRQADAMEALREGMRNLGDAMRQEAQNQQGESAPTGAGGEGEDENGRGPLGRIPGGNAPATDSPFEDSEDAYRRAQELIEELRRRSGETERPQIERDYIERLLEDF